MSSRENMGITKMTYAIFIVKLGWFSLPSRPPSWTYPVCTDEKEERNIKKNIGPV
jgi:hypothetical protein